MGHSFSETLGCNKKEFDSALCFMYTALCAVFYTTLCAVLYTALCAVLYTALWAVFYTALCAVLSCIFLLTPRCLMEFFLSWACLWKPHYSKNHFSLFIRGPSYGWVPFMKNVWHCPFIVLTVCLLCVVLSQHCVN